MSYFQILFYIYKNINISNAFKNTEEEEEEEKHSATCLHTRVKEVEMGGLRAAEKHRQQSEIFF